MKKEIIEAIATKVHWDLIPALECGSSRAILVEIVTKVLEAYEASHTPHVPKMAEIKEILIACQDALRYEDSWDAKDVQMLITKAIKLCEEK